MNIMFAIGNGYLPEFYGGVQSSTDQLVRQLYGQGHNASVLAALFGSGVFGLKARLKMKALRRPAAIDEYPGYPVVRGWKPADIVDFAVERFRPDVAVVQCHQTVPMAKAFQRLNVPLVVYLRNVEFHELAGDPRELHSALYISNSSFTAATYEDKFGIKSTVIPPLIDPDAYKTQSTREYVTFINPYSEKGFELAVSIAKCCPEIPFLFVESWQLGDEHRNRVEQTIAPVSNIRLESRTNDMRTVYGRTKILLVPSKWEEAWGRVASEAHCSAIPVIGSRRGGLPEAIGSGGITLDYESAPEEWAAVVKRVWNDEVYYSELSQAALSFAARPEMDAGQQFLEFFNVLKSAENGRKQLVDV